MKYHIEFDLELKKNVEKGLYIAFEGIDASGKETQSELLKKYFEKKGKKVILTSEPNEKLPIGKLVKKILKSDMKVPPEALQYLFTADRVINHTNLVIPGLKSGKIVVSHRSFWSALPYGVLDKDREYNLSEKHQIMIAQGILSMYHQFIKPDITFFLDISVKESLKRLAKMKRKKEIYEKKEKLEKILKGYKLLIKEFPKEFTIINGGKSSEEVFQSLIQYLTKYEK